MLFRLETLLLVICLLRYSQETFFRIRFRRRTSPTVCRDRSANCKYHIQNCQTSSDVRYYCQKSCGLCGTTTRQPTVTKPACVDPPQCDYYTKGVKELVCAAPLIRIQCRAFCNDCGKSTTPTKTTTKGATTTTATTTATTTTTTTTSKATTRKITTTTKAICGVSSIRSARIINGNISKPGEWPWQAALLRDDVFVCGGVLISPTWVLTAAQCIDRISVSSIKVVLGEHHREVPSGNEQIISAAHFETHGRYNNPTNLNNDIALIRLSKPARLNKYVKPICLPLQGTKPGKGRCYLSGWGKSTQPGNHARELHHGKLSIVEYDKCKKSNSKYVPITPQMLCTTGENMASGCYGDNGGPFVCQAADGRWTLHGVFSWGSPRCSASDAYSVFARVSAFRQWIDRFV